MHIGLIGPAGPDRFADNIGDSLRRMGHQVSMLGSTRPPGRPGTLVSRAGELVLRASPVLEARLHTGLAHKALDRECDVVINTAGGLSPAAVAALRRERVPVALWFPDAVTSMGRQRMLTAPYTALFFKEPLLVQRLRATLGLPVWYLPQACNPRWHRPVGDVATDRAIVVVGNVYPSRLMLLRRLHEAGVPLVIYGGGVPRWARDLLPPHLHTGRAVFREEKSRVFRSAAGVLNNLHPAEMHGMNLRLFEATAAGAAVLCERRPVLADLFDPEREVIAFSDFTELLDGVRRLLTDRELPQEIGDAASKRAHAEHAYDVRLPTILERLT